MDESIYEVPLDHLPYSSRPLDEVPRPYRADKDQNDNNDSLDESMNQQLNGSIQVAANNEKENFSPVPNQNGNYLPQNGGNVLYAQPIHSKNLYVNQSDQSGYPIHVPQPKGSSTNFNNNSGQKQAPYHTTSDGRRRSTKTGKDLGPENSFHCPICDKKLQCQSRVLEHVAAVHEEQRIYDCVFCDQTYKYKSNLRAHIKKKHKTEKPICPVCVPKKSFAKFEDMLKHIMYSHQNVSQAPLNIKKYETSQQLEEKRNAEAVAMAVKKEQEEAQIAAAPFGSEAFMESITGTTTSLTANGPKTVEEIKQIYKGRQAQGQAYSNMRRLFIKSKDIISGKYKPGQDNHRKFGHSSFLDSQSPASPLSATGTRSVPKGIRTAPKGRKTTGYKTVLSSDQNSGRSTPARKVAKKTVISQNNDSPLVTSTKNDTTYSIKSPNPSINSQQDNISNLKSSNHNHREVSE